MAISGTNESKNETSGTNESKSDNSLWSERLLTWDDSGPGGDTWGVPGTAGTPESKNEITGTNETKN